MRGESFGQHKLSLLDKFILFLRTKKIKPYLFQADTVVDMGCGYNAVLLSWILRKFNIRYGIGVDLSVNRAAETKNLSLLEHDLNGKLSIPDQSADLIISMAVLEHLSNPLEHLREIHRILKPGGYLLLTTPTKPAKFVLEFLAYRLKLIDATEIADHKHYFNSPELKTIMEQSFFIPDEIRLNTFLFGLNNLVSCRKK